MTTPTVTRGRAVFEASGSPVAKIRSYVAQTVTSLLEAQRRAASERVLRRLDSHLLRDIGLNRAEIGKPSRQMEEFLARLHCKTLR